MRSHLVLRHRDKPIELHDMPNPDAVTTRVPAAELLTPRRRPWPRLVLVGTAAGAVGVGVGMALGATALAPADPMAGHTTSLRLEHLAQTPSTAVGDSVGLANEHQAQKPGVDPTAFSSGYVRPDAPLGG